MEDHAEHRPRDTQSERDRRFSDHQLLSPSHDVFAPRAPSIRSTRSLASFSSISTRYPDDQAIGRSEPGIAADALEFPGFEPGELDVDQNDDQLPWICEGCASVNSLFWCHICDVTVCDECWPRQAAHNNARRLQTRGTHEQTELVLRDIIHWILRPNTERDTDGRHAMDYMTKWFGVTIQPGDDGDVSLQTTPRYRELSVGVGVEMNQFPSLISFVGETGAGKSTLISALMKVSS